MNITVHSVKLMFALREDMQSIFNIGTESIWCDKENDLYRVKNIPFFILGISFDDLIAVKEVSDGLFEVDQIVEECAYSNI